MTAEQASEADSIDEKVRLRDDLAVVELDGDLVVYDPVEPACHVLSGGAVLVWAELDGGGPVGIVERICARVGAEADEIGDEVVAMMADLERLGLLAPTDRHPED